MKLYDNDRHRDTFTELVYELLSDDPTWHRANQIIESFDSAPAVELPDTTLGGTYVNIEWLKRTEAELKKYKELAAHPQGGPGDDSIEIVKPAEGDPHAYLNPCRICGNTEIVYERYRHLAGEPVWVQSMISGWAIVDAERGCCTNERGETADFERYGELWLAYRRKPEEV